MTSSGVLEAQRWEGSGPSKQSGWWSSGRACWAGDSAGGGPPPWATAWKGGGQRGSENPAAPGPGRVRLPWEAPARGEGARLCALPQPRRQRRDPDIAPVPVSFCGACFTPTPPTGSPRSDSDISPGGLSPPPGGGQSPGRARVLGVQLCGREQRTTDPVCASVTLLPCGRSARPWERDAGRHLPLL